MGHFLVPLLRVERGRRVIDDVRDSRDSMISRGGDYIRGRIGKKDFFMYFFEDFI